MKYLALSVILILSVSLNSCSGDKTSSTKNSSSEEIKNAAASKTIGGDNGNVVSDGGVNVRRILPKVSSQPSKQTKETSC